MFMEDNTHVVAKRDKKNLKEGTLFSRNVKQEPSGGQSEEEFSRKCDEMKSTKFWGT